MKSLVLTLAISLAFAFGGVAQSLHYDFEDGTLQGWTTLDGDGDGHCWEPSIGGMGHNSNGMVMAYSKDYATGEPLTPNEYLVSPRLVLSEDGPVIRFYVCALDEIYRAEHFGVSISTTVNNDPLAFTLLSQWTIAAKDAGNRQGNWYNYTVDLSAYTGQEVYVAIRHHYCSGQSAICVDDIEIDGTIQQDGLVISPDILTFEEPWVPQTFTISNQTDAAVTISSINVEPDDNVVLLSGPGLPRTLQPNETMNVEVYVNGIGYKGYLTYYVNVATSIGYRQVTVRVNEEAWDEGLLWMPMQGLTFDENSPLTQGFNLTNTNALDSITIYELYEDGTDYLELVPSHSLPYVIPPHESLYIDVTLINFPENNTNVNIYSSSSLGQGSSPYVHIAGGLSPSNGDLVINPDTLWFYHNGDIEYFTVTNEYSYPVQIDSMGDYGGYLWPGYDLPNLPYTIGPGESVSFNFRFTYPVKDNQDLREYVTTSVSIFTSVGQRELPVMIDQAGMVNLLFAREMYFDNPSGVVQTMIMNKSWYIPTIRVLSITEKDTDYLNIETYPEPPFDLELSGDVADLTVTLKDLAKGYARTNIEIETDYGTFEIAVFINDTILDDCDAPESFSGQYQQESNGNQYAVLLWENLMHDFWFHYDEESMSGAVDVAQWGIKIPAETFDDIPCELRKVKLFKTNCQNQEGSCYVKIYFGEDTPVNMVEIEHHTLEAGPDEWIEVELTTPIACTSSNSVWIVIETDGLSNVAAYCPTAGDPNGRWAWSSENGWHDYYAETGQGGDWLIQAFFESLAKEDNEVAHFNIYRGESLNAMERIAETSKFAHYYWDDHTNEPGDYYYRLTASYENGCESAYALDSEHPENDYVLVTIPGDMIPAGSEWYYEIQNDDGSITYQYLYQAGDTIVQDEPTHILVKINTLYDKDLHQDVTHEYVYERNGKLYWWNKTLEEFTVLYDFGAHEGDTWVTKVGTETLTMHVDAEEIVEYEGRFYRMLHVSDTDDIFSGDIVCGIGHLTSFFPERLMDNGDGIRVEGMRCYWVENELVFKYGDEDCDAIYSDIHGVEEESPSTGSGALTVYPNPTNGVLFVETRLIASLPDQTYRISNLMGQTVLSGNINADNQQINVSSLPQGMYFITFANVTRKFVVR